MTTTWRPLDWRAVARARRTARLGGRIVYRSRLDSTNRLARLLMRDGAADGTVVVADDQTAGRGRLGRGWQVPPRSGLTLSIGLLLPEHYPLHTLSAAAALALADTAASVAAAPCTLKWPNDVLVGALKVAGILVELDRTASGWTAIVGIGLNVNAAPDLPTATCLADVAGRAPAREPLLVDLLARLEAELSLSATTPATLMARWRARLDTLGRPVQVHEIERDWHGLAVDVDAEGSLLVRDEEGMVRAVRAGDVSLGPR